MSLPGAREAFTGAVSKEQELPSPWTLLLSWESLDCYGSEVMRC